jgi:hypothetical protein
VLERASYSLLCLLEGHISVVCGITNPSRDRKFPRVGFPPTFYTSQGSN